MKRAELRFELLSYWHAGTGRGDGERADAVVQVDALGLPYLPGRTVKGLLRSTAELGVSCELVRADQVRAWFGSALIDDGQDRVRALEEQRFQSTEGVLRFGSATLGPEWSAWAAGLASGPHATDVQVLRATLASTRIDDQTGVASDRTLRTIEVAVPMTLTAQVHGPDGEWPATLAALAPLLRSLGSGRNRGLGRVALTVKEVQ